MSDDVLDAIAQAVPNLFETTNPLMGEALRMELAQRVLGALSTAGLVVLRDPSGTAQHGDELVRVEAEVGPVVDDEDDWRALARHEVFLLRRSVPEGSEQ